MFKFASAVFACLLGAVSCFADSQVRIVRLSDVEGGVQINRNVKGYEKAFLNLPITQGNQVRTEEEGRAQIEFEDGSALRLAPGSNVRFSQLSLADSGMRISSVILDAGMAYVDFKGAKNDQLTLIFGHEKMVLNRPAHLRIDMSATRIAVASFEGEASIESPSGTVQLSKKRTAVFDLADSDTSKVSKNIEPAPYDAWDKQQDRYQQRYTDNVLASSSPYAYGVSDLSYYGTYFNAPGYGMVWQPYLIGANWDPFMNGAWAFYPGAGYGWVSAYPWGWAPYHSGNWAFIPGRGWAWQPGGTWTSLNTHPQVSNAPANFVSPKPPAIASQSLVVVNRGPAASLVGHSSSKVLIRNDSAGLGVPRGEVKNLAAISNRVSTQGAVTTRIHSAPVQTVFTTAGEPQTYGSATGPAQRSSGISSASRSSSPQANPGGQRSAPAAPPMRSAGRGSKN